MRRFLVASVVVTVALVAVTSLGASAAPDTTAMTTAKVKAAGISLKYPSSWALVPLTKKGLAAMEKVLSKKNPKLAALMAEADPSQYKLRAIDPTGSANVGVQFIEGTGSPSTLAEVKSAIVPGYEAAGGTVLDVAPVKISGKTAYRVDVTLPIKSPDGSLVVERLGQLLVPQGDNATIVNAAASNDDAGAALIDSIIGSVRRV